MLAHNGAIFERKMRATISPELSPPDQIRRTARFYLDHYIENRDYFQIFWAIENQSVIGELPPGVVEEVARLWEQCVTIVAEVIEDAVERGFFIECDAWEVANLLWTIANGLIQTETSATRRKLRRISLDRAFEDAIEVVLRGLAPRGEVTA